MHHYVAQEIIRQRADEMQAQARQDRAARQAREARHSREAEAAKEARRPGQASLAPGAGAEVIPLPRVPDYVDGTFRDAGSRSRAC
ncbi:MAG TPA: hypothetical protein VMG38_08525 [Trebonia sp.]|nr:hypothetical protein [Trebonia sp.]